MERGICPETEGQRLDIYFHYRNDAGITEDKIPDSKSLRADAINFMQDNAGDGVC